MLRAGTLDQHIEYARAAPEAGLHELFVDFAQTPATFAERVDLPAGSSKGSAGAEPGPRNASVRPWVLLVTDHAVPSAASARGHGMPYAPTGEALKRPDSRNEPPRLRRVRIPGTVPLLPPAAVRRPRDEEEEQEPSGTDVPREAVE